MSRRVHILVSGKVQGVFYRATACKKAVALGLSGWARNLADGRVEILAEGEAGRVGEFIVWCGHGPALARVAGVEVVDEAPRGDLPAFDVRPDA